jgi:hypothetical protein
MLGFVLPQVEDSDVEYRACKESDHRGEWGIDTMLPRKAKLTKRCRWVTQIGPGTDIATKVIDWETGRCALIVPKVSLISLFPNIS